MSKYLSYDFSEFLCTPIAPLSTHGSAFSETATLPLFASAAGSGARHMVRFRLSMSRAGRRESEPILFDRAHSRHWTLSHPPPHFVHAKSNVHGNFPDGARNSGPVNETNPSFPHRDWRSGPSLDARIGLSRDAPYALSVVQRGCASALKGHLLMGWVCTTSSESRPFW